MTREEASLFKNNTTPLSVHALDDLSNRGYKFVQVKGFNGDHEPDYVEPHCIMLVPMKELPGDDSKKDIYEPVTSSLLVEMAAENNPYIQVLISGVA
jgi:hypothetical protein